MMKTTSFILNFLFLTGIICLVIAVISVTIIMMFIPGMPFTTIEQNHPGAIVTFFVKHWWLILGLSSLTVFYLTGPVKYGFVVNTARKIVFQLPPRENPKGRWLTVIRGGQIVREDLLPPDYDLRVDKTI